MSVLTRLALSAATSVLLVPASPFAASPDPQTPPAPAPTAARAAAGTGGSLVFLKQHNVWIARGDGGHARKVTRDGTAARPYLSPSQSDRGVIVAARGPLILRMTQHGKVLTRLNPPTLHNSAGEPMNGTVNDVAVSPDGKRVAWSYVRYSCPIGVDCMVRYATGYTAATKLTHAGRSTFYRAPSWVTSTRTLQTGGFRSQVMLQDLKGAPRHWFDDIDYASPSTDLADGALSRDGHWLAQVRGYGATSSIIWYRVDGDAKHGAPPAVPQYTCYTGGEAKHASPTWSPDSTALVWAGREGLWLKRDAADCAVQPRLLIRGASAPDWSPATLR